MGMETKTLQLSRLECDLLQGAIASSIYEEEKALKEQFGEDAANISPELLAIIRNTGKRNIAVLENLFEQIT